MPSSLFGSPHNPVGPGRGNPAANGNLIQRFLQFKREMAGKDPEAIVRQMLADGRMSPQQFEKLKAQAQSLVGILR